MAYAALVSLSQTVDLFLNYHHNAISPQVKHQMISINEYTIFLQDFLQHFQDKANRVEAMIRAVTQAVEDIVEIFMSEHIPHEPRYKHYMKSSLRHNINEHICHDFHDLKEAADEIKWIAEMLMKMKSYITVKGERSTVNSSSRVSSAHKDTMVGFENAILEIKSRLCGESSKLEVIPVVGMGGIGKTTLARNVCDDPLIMENFEIREWVTVSQIYSVEEIISNLLVSMKVFDAKDESMEAHHVFQHLKSRKYLIVLDDVWSTETWDDLKMMFPDDGNRSRIMITTRLSDAATYPDPYSRPHKMHLMDMDLSWKLLQQKIFKKEECPAELEYAGKVIARNCRGLPLAIVVISGILSSIDHTASAWDDIAQNVTKHISADSEQFDKILSLSYTHLPYHLRPCLLYMGLFQEDYEVRASRLMKLWAAEGFLKPNGCNKSLEETAEENMEHLVRRSLVLVTRRKSDGKIKSLSMHDLTRKMCLRISQEEKFFLHGHMLLRRAIGTVRTYHVDFPENFSGWLIRAILPPVLVPEIFSLQDLRLLRILDLLDADDRRLPAQISELFHLRYLAFCGVFNSRICMSNLQNLQTLMIYSSLSGKLLRHIESDHFPFVLEIWGMLQLRHLVLCSGFFFCLPRHQQGAKLCLQNLQTLSLVVNFICTPEILEAIPNLKKLAIWYNARRDVENDYHLHNLVYLLQLENLKLKIDREFPSRQKVKPAFPSTLKKLSLTSVRLPWEDMEIVGSLPNLEVLKLRDYACEGDTWETNEGEFTQLKFLLIDESELQNWITESSHFPKLVRLVLLRCQKLSEIPNDIGDVPTLEVIEVDDEVLFKSAKQIQEDQQSYGNEDLQVRLLKAHMK